MNKNLYTYSHSTKSLVQKPGMEKPIDVFPDKNDLLLVNSITQFNIRMDEYDQHLKERKEYSCSWLDQSNDGQKLVEGKDFKIEPDYQCSRHSYLHPDESCDGKPTAIPLPKDAPVEDQDWIERFKDWYINTSGQQYLPWNLIQKWLKANERYF